ncbi:hypothetical protein ECG_08853 [Echinococcus granulosus]|uniref:Expressed conserved protein n=1 Tax=Echinococcus granulosus TaxID=6210 RepID=A0A068WYX0_ECHGR|nr:hypothetical protein ECG_08854 [Echinococcus granulosus]KAH9278390.1 hypothetical protein ECG_08853 [Echinococcus granulosus]CDS23719.1 expressed conserved protein [Echinococcus granulosus]
MISLKTLSLLALCICLAFSQDPEAAEGEAVTEAGGAVNDTLLDGKNNASDALAAEDSVCGLRLNALLVVGSLIMYKLLA